jgi:flagellar hook-length control protein FliK
VPHVASETTSHALNRRLPPLARPAQAPDRAPPAPFASLLDDRAPAPERPAQPAPDDHASRAARSDQAQQPAKSQDGKAAKAKDDAGSADAGKDAKTDKAGKTAKADKTDTTDKVAGDGKTAADTKTADAKTADKTGKPTDGKDATPVSDGKPADALVLAEAATAPSADPMPTITTAEPTVTALPPAPADATVTVLPPAAVPPAAPAAENSALVATPAKPDTLAALQADHAKAADNQALAPKAAAPSHGEATSHGEAKPQGPTSDADKDTIAHARGELADSGHRAAAPQAQAALATDANAAAPKTVADAAQPTVLTAPPQNTAPAAATPAATAPAPQPAAIPLAGVAIEIAGKALAGKNHFEIRLDPPELGRIEVRLDVDRDGNVTSRMIVDRADTLDLLRRDASGLERALQDAGLKTSNNGLQFSLRDQAAHQQQASGGADTARLVVEDEMLPTIDATPRGYSRLAGLGNGVDIQV